MNNYLMLCVNMLSFSTYVVYSLGGICESDVCEFQLVVRRERTMTYTAQNGRTYNVIMNNTENKLQIVEDSFNMRMDDLMIGQFVEVDDVITTDGYARNVILVNDKFPGPTLEVMEGAQVVVKVFNELEKEGVTVHWHGLHMKNNVWMDGTAYITQCPIMPHQSFTYRFIADPAGTHWYHGHLSNQRLDGLYGALIVHRSVPDIPYYVMMIHDWSHKDADTLQIMSPFIHKGSGDEMYSNNDRYYSLDGTQMTSVRYTSTLINGKGKVDYANEKLPLYRYNVSSKHLYNFRVIHTGAEYIYEVMVDNHILVVMATDGHNIEPLTVDSFYLGPGERVDFQLFTDQEDLKSYWIRAEIEMRKKQSNIEIKGGMAVLTYTNDSKNDPESDRKICTAVNRCKVFNCPFKHYPMYQHKNCISLSDVTSGSSDSFLNDVYGLNDNNCEEYFLNIGFHVGSSINARRFMSPRSPLIGNHRDRYTKSCDTLSCETGCTCTNILNIPFNKTIQLVISNYESQDYVNHHIMHLHGHSFLVMKMGFPELNKTTGMWSKFNDDIRCDTDTYCANANWTNSHHLPHKSQHRPYVKDSVMVPGRGYTVIRFRSTNPGYWLFHCHQSSHLHEGMAMLLNVAPSYHPTTPNNFIQCGDFDWTSEDFTSYIACNERNIDSGPCIISDNLNVNQENVIKLSLSVLFGLLFGCASVGAVLSLAVYRCLWNLEKSK